MADVTADAIGLVARSPLKFGFEFEVEVGDDAETDGGQMDIPQKEKICFRKLNCLSGPVRELNQRSHYATIIHRIPTTSRMYLDGFVSFLALMSFDPSGVFLLFSYKAIPHCARHQYFKFSLV